MTAQEAVRISPASPLPYRWLAASFGQLGHSLEAVAALQTLAEIGSGLADDQISQRPRHWRAADYEHLLEGLRNAGWQEGC